MKYTRYAQCKAYITRDGSEIRELMHPAQHDCTRQSLAEAIVRPGQTTALHRHTLSEELYHITRGRGLMTLGKEQFEVCVGDTLVIAPGTAHCIENIGDDDLHILCCCAPAYAHNDTELL